MIAFALPDPHLNYTVLFRALLPLASVLLIAGFWPAIVSASSTRDLLLTVAKFAAIVGLIANFSTLADLGQNHIQDMIVNTLKARPDEVASRYLDRLHDQKDTPKSKSVWSKITSPATSAAEGILASLLWFFSILAGWILALAYLFQKLVLQASYGLCPLFLALLGISAVRSVGVHFLLSVSGILLWPLGWAVASLVTDDLLNYVAEQSLVPAGGTVEALSWSVRTVFTTMLIGLWIVFTTFATPPIIQRAITTGVHVGTSLLASGFTTLKTFARL